MNSATQDYRKHGIPARSSGISDALLIAALIATLIAVLAWMGERDQAAARQHQPGHPAFIKLSLSDCPAAAPGLSEILVFTISTTGDGKPSLSGCSRIAERGYAIKQAKGIEK